MQTTRPSPADQYYRVLFDASNDVMLVLEPRSGMILDANHAFTELFGYTSAEWENLSLSSVVCNEKQAFSDTLSTGLHALREPLKFECLAVCKSQANFWVQAILKPIVPCLSEDY